MADDDELVADMLAAQGESTAERSSAFGFTDWTHERELLTELVDAVRALRATLVAVNSRKGKAPKVRPMPRPITAVDRIERRTTLSRHKERTRALLGR